MKDIGGFRRGRGGRRGKGKGEERWKGKGKRDGREQNIEPNNILPKSILGLKVDFSA